MKLPISNYKLQASNHKLERACLSTHNQLLTPKAKAFTLIELLVAMVITGIMLTLVMASYWTFLKTQQRMAVSRELQAEVRFALNRMADKIRYSTLNYTEYSSGQCDNTNQKLCLINTAGDTFFFAFDSTAKSLVMGPNDANTQPLISPQKFAVESLHFDYAPAAAPNTLSVPNKSQPKVTVFLKVAPQDVRYQDLIIENQTTISSRQY